MTLKLPAKFPRRVQTSVIRPHSVKGGYVYAMFAGQAIYSMHAARTKIQGAEGRELRKFLGIEPKAAKAGTVDRSGQQAHYAAAAGAVQR